MQQDRTSSPESALLARRLLGIVASSWKSQATYVAAELRIADLLADGPKTAEALAGATGTHGPSLRRLLRALTTIEICSEGEDGSFEITPMGSLLSAEAAASVRSWTLFWGAQLMTAWTNLLHSVETGESATKRVIGAESFDHLEGNREVAGIFNQAMVELTRLVSQEVVRAYDFSEMKQIVDVGGGYGELLSRILRANPGARGVLFDLPHAIEDGRRHFEAAGLTSRCDFVAGSFFESAPRGADAYVLKSVIHDWNDERSAVILETCRRAMAPHSRLLLVERVVPERLGVSPAHQAIAQSDLTMLVAMGAQERTEAEFRRLLGSSGFRVTRILPAGEPFSVIEAVPAQ